MGLGLVLLATALSMEIAGQVDGKAPIRPPVAPPDVWAYDTEALLGLLIDNKTHGDVYRIPVGVLLPVEWRETLAQYRVGEDMYLLSEATLRGLVRGPTVAQASSSKSGL
jgi:hypothetical protein